MEERWFLSVGYSPRISEIHQGRELISLMVAIGFGDGLQKDVARMRLSRLFRGA